MSDESFHNQKVRDMFKCADMFSFLNGASEGLNQGFKNGVDALAESLKNPITLDALVSARDRYTVIAIIKRQVEQLKE